MIIILHGAWVPAAFAVAGVFLCLFVDAFRHLILFSRAYFSWYVKLDRADRVIDFSEYARRFIRVTDILDPPRMAGAPAALRTRYRSNVAWFLAEWAAAMVVVLVFIAVTNAFA